VRESIAKLRAHGEAAAMLGDLEWCAEPGMLAAVDEYLKTR